MLLWGRSGPVSEAIPAATARASSQFLNSSTYFTKIPLLRRTPPDGYPSMRQQNLSRLDRHHQLHRYPCPATGGILAEGIVPLCRDHPYRDTGVGAGDAPIV